ncbi:MAG: DUF1571 domain-containing protein [Candidatus Rokuibacteriota bacterium]
MTIVLALVLALLLPGRAVGAADPAAVAVLEAMEPAYARVSAYTARFIRQELVGGRLRPREEALLKFQRPHRFYLRWIAGPPAGREMLYPADAEGRVLVHEPGMVTRLFTAVLEPDSAHVLRESRHPVTDIGIGRLVTLILDNARRALREGQLEIVERGVSTDGDAQERRLELVFPRAPEARYYAYRAVVGIDVQTHLPVTATIFDAEGRMVEDYAYRDVRLNPPLTALDFDPANPEYRFPRWRVRP